MMVSNRFKKISGALLFSSLFVLAAFSGALATENGGGIYAGGNEDFMTAALPPPGFYYLNYLLWYHADKYEDLRLNGVKAKKIFGVEPDFDLDLLVNAFRFVYVANCRILGANLAFQTILPVMNVDVSTSLPVAKVKDSTAGLGDITFDPIILGWHFKNLHLAAALEFNAPTGSFDVDEAANPGRNYWNFEPVFAFTYLGNVGFEVSAKFMYDFNARNSDTDYKSGQELHFDYAVGQHLGKNWTIGVNGSYYLQTTDDDFPNEPSSFDGNKGRSFGIGPALSYSYKNMTFGLKYQWETDVENRPEGEKLWARFIYAF